MGRVKIPVVRTHKLELIFSDVEIIKVLSLAVCNPSLTSLKVSGTGSVQFDSKVISQQAVVEISERVANLAIQRRKIPKLTQKISKLTSQSDSDSINLAQETLKTLAKAKAVKATPPPQASLASKK
jgi:hypothetical protein